MLLSLDRVARMPRVPDKAEPFPGLQSTVDQLDSDKQRAS